MVWIELRGKELQAVTAVSGDGGASWSATAIASIPGRGDVLRAGARFGANEGLRVVYARHPSPDLGRIDSERLAVEVVELAFSAPPAGGG